MALIDAIQSYLLCEQELNMKYLHICKCWCTDEDKERKYTRTDRSEQTFSERLSKKQTYKEEFQSNTIPSVDPIYK